MSLPLPPCLGMAQPEPLLVLPFELAPRCAPGFLRRRRRGSVGARQAFALVPPTGRKNDRVLLPAPFRTGSSPTKDRMIGRLSMGDCATPITTSCGTALVRPRRPTDGAEPPCHEQRLPHHVQHPRGPRWASRVRRGAKALSAPGHEAGGADVRGRRCGRGRESQR